MNPTALLHLCSRLHISQSLLSLSLSLMAMATSSAAFTLSSGAHFQSFNIYSTKSTTLGGHRSNMTFRQKLNKLNPRRNLSVCAEYNDGSRGGGGDFLAGFLIGGTVFGTLAYVFAPQIRRSLLNEDEYGFRRAKRPIYYDEGLEKTRQTLNTKISQLNSAIDNVSSRLRGVNNEVPEPIEPDSEIEAAM